MKPIVICAKEEVYVESGQEADIEGYTVGHCRFLRRPLLIPVKADG